MRKLSFGMFFFVILPLVGSIVLYALGYRLLALLGILFVAIVLGSVIRAIIPPSLEKQILRDQAKRAMEKKKLLLAIGDPDGPGNTLSPQQHELWEQYKELNEIDDRLSTEERKQLSDALERAQ